MRHGRDDDRQVAIELDYVLVVFDDFDLETYKSLKMFDIFPYFLNLIYFVVRARSLQG